MADDEKTLLEQARKLPLEERVEHKNWKVRSEALEYIREECGRARSAEAPIFSEAGEWQGRRARRLALREHSSPAPPPGRAPRAAPRPPACRAAVEGAGG